MTELSRQLESLSSAYRPQTTRKTASFLFEDAVAKNISRDQYHQIGVRGVSALAQIDPRFNPFVDGLFGQRSKDVDRLTMMPAEATKLDKEIEDFLWLLSPYFMRPCSHEALEYLLYQYECNVHLPEQMLRCALPYHDHLYFMRLVQLLSLRDTRWRWLKHHQESGMTLGHALLVRHLSADEALLNQVVDWVREADKRGAAGSPQVNLFVAGVTGVLALATRRAGGVGDRLLTIAVTGAESLYTGARTVDAQAAAAAVMCAICATTSVTHKLTCRMLNVLAKSLTHTASATLPQETIMKAMCITAARLGKGPLTPELAATFLRKVPWAELVGPLSGTLRSSEGRGLLLVVLRQMVAMVAKKDAPWTSLNELLEQLQVAESVAGPLTEQCLEAVVQGGGEAVEIRNVLQMLERRAPRGFDAGVKAALKRVGEEKDSKAEGIIFEVLRSHFSGTRHGVVKSDKGEFTLTVACVHHDPAVRRVAADHLLASKASDLLIHMVDGEEDPGVLKALLAGAGKKVRAACGGQEREYRTAVASLCRRVLRTARLPPDASAAVAAAAAAAATVDPAAAMSPGKRRKVQPGAGVVDWPSAVSLLSTMHQLLLLKPERRHTASASAALQAAADQLDGNAVFAHVAAALTADPPHAAALANAAAALPPQALAAYEAALEGRCDPSAAVHCTAVLSSASDAAPLFVRLRSAGLSVLHETVPERLRGKSTSLAGAAFHAALAATAVDGGHGWRLKLLHLGIALRVLEPGAGKGMSDEALQMLKADAWSYVARCRADPKCKKACDSVMLQHASPKLTARLLVRDGTPKEVRAAALRCSADDGAPACGDAAERSGFVAAVLCCMQREEEEGAGNDLAELAPAALTRIAAGDDRSPASRLASFVASAPPTSVRLTVAEAAKAPRGESSIADLTGAVVAGRIGGAAPILSAVVSLEKLRGLLPLLSSLVGHSRPETVTTDDALLAAAGVGAFSALLTPAVQKKWRGLSDRSMMHEMLCLCVSQHEAWPVQASPSSEWCYTGSEKPREAGVLSLSDLVVKALVNADGTAREGASEMLACFDPAEVSQFLDAVVVLTQKGVASGRKLITALRSQLGAALRRRCGHSVANLQPAGEDADPKRRRVEEVTQQTDATQCLELLSTCHPGGGAPVDGQEPLESAAAAWFALERTAGVDGYLTNVAVSLLANCAEEVAAAVKAHVQAGVERGEKQKRKNVDPAAVFPNVCWDSSDNLRPKHGLMMVDVQLFTKLLGSVKQVHIRHEGFRCLRALARIHPGQVYEGCLEFAVGVIGSEADRGVVPDLLQTLMPVLLRGEGRDGVAGLIHVVLYSYTTRTHAADAALDACHDLLLGCSVRQQLTALTRFLCLQVDTDADSANAIISDPRELKLLRMLGARSQSLSEAQVEARMLLFVLRHLSHSRFLDAVLDAEDGEEEDGGGEEFVELFVCALRICEQNGCAVDHEADDDSSDLSPTNADRSSKLEEENLYDLAVSAKTRSRQLIDAVLDLMPAAVFVVAIQELLTGGRPQMRALGLRLFNARLGAAGGRLSHADGLAFLSMLPDLRDSLRAGGGSEAVQNALWTLEILARHVAGPHPRSFPHFLPTLTGIVAKADQSEPAACHLVSSAVLCIGHIVVQVGELALEHLPLFTPAVVAAARAAVDGAREAGDQVPEHLRLLLESSLCCMEKMLQALGVYLSPHYAEFISLSADSVSSAVAGHRVAALMDAAHDKCERRLLLPALASALGATDHNRAEHGLLWSAVSRVVRDMPPREIADGASAELLALVASQMKAYTAKSLAPLSILEALGDGASALSLKMDEAQLSDAMARLEQVCFTHGADAPGPQHLRALTAFYILVQRMQDRLGGIFVFTYKTFLPQTCSLLEMLQGSVPSSSAARKLVSTCAVAVLQTMRTLAETDEDNELGRSPELAGKAAEAAIQILPSEALLGSGLALPLSGPGGSTANYDDRCQQLLRPLLSRLCTECQDRSLWGRIQKGLLRAHRHGSGAPRRCALSTLRGVYEDCGEDFASAMVAEILQPLSEALEDDDNGVAEVAEDFVRTASKLTGEDVSRYMRGER